MIDEDKVINGSTIKEGDVCIGLASNGLHTNGYTLARKVAFEIAGKKPGDPLPGTDMSVDQALMQVHRCYAPLIHPLLDKHEIHGMAHITGGGITDNLPRVMPDGLRAIIKVGSCDVPPVFRILAEKGQVPEDDMWRTFNLGVGMILVVPPKSLDKVLAGLRESGCPGFPMGNVVKGKSGVEYDHPPEGFPSGLR